MNPFHIYHRIQITAGHSSIKRLEMSGCAIKRWGPGTPCNRDETTPAAKEMSNALSAMRLERERQDNLWRFDKVDTPPSVSPNQHKVEHKKT